MQETEEQSFPMASMILSKLHLLTVLLRPDKSLILSGSTSHKLAQFLRCAISIAVFCLRLLVSSFVAIMVTKPGSVQIKEKPPSAESGISRALSQMLSLVSDIPVSSRKYQLIRCLAEKLMDDNVRDGNLAVNRTVVGAAFSKTISRVEAAESNRVTESYELGRTTERLLARAYNGVVCCLSDSLGLRDGTRSTGDSAEKLASELLWLAQKMRDCGAVEEAISTLGSASCLARIALSAEPRVQESLVKLSVFLLKHAKELEHTEEVDENGTQEETKVKMLMSWLPLLCRATNGTDSPILSIGEKIEMEIVLDEMIDQLTIQNQEKILALWLHHFTCYPDSDWPNLQVCYARWYAMSRKLSQVN